MIDLGAVYIDRKGWAQSKLRGTWDSLARRNLPWTPAEDARLLRRHAALSRKAAPMWMFLTLSTEHGRSGPAVMTRIAALRAGIRFAEMTKKQNARKRRRA